MKVSLLFLFALCSLFSEELCLFFPPKGWQPAKPEHLSEYVEVGFITQGKGGFHPSINLAKGTIDISFKEYIKAVKEIHSAEPGTTWRDLGSFSMKGGRGRLTEISSGSAWGPITLLQAILVKGNTAYILTAATLKSEFLNHRKELIQSLKSLSFAPDLFAALPDEAEKKYLKTVFDRLAHLSDLEEKQKEREWKDLQKKVAAFEEEMGSYWQLLALKEGHARIYSPSKLQ